MSCPPPSRENRASSSIRWFTRLCAQRWAASCMPSRCRPRHPPTPDPPIREEQGMTDQNVIDRIKREVGDNDVVLFMKGTPVFPQCGFSAAVVQVLTHLGVPFKGVDVLTDPSLREGVKHFSNWPTIPQLYVKSEFVGGCDIVREMFQSGELTELLSAK